ncbi:Cys-Gln thioester bond-forming surface protein [Streptomyces sp. NPDC002795]|uniref:Cys-Gln thioester bond-forming surface protein n=1 Tax=Streptomyces sp. NPDC002795 TaxID=3364665 RepID=UPI00368D6106
MATGAISGAGVAQADDGATEQRGASATLAGLETYDTAVIHEAGKDEKVSAGLFRMAVDDGGTLQTYCVDIHNPTQPDAKYQETSWAGTSLHDNANAGRIRWILQNSYPQVNDLAALARKAHAGSLTEQEAAAGTQVAIWRYSDEAGKVDVDAASPDAEKLADYLQRSARDLAEPQASLTLTPQAVSARPDDEASAARTDAEARDAKARDAKAGNAKARDAKAGNAKARDRVGPVTVHTNADSVTVMPPAEAAAGGVKLVDEKGEPVTTAKDGSRLYFAVPKGAKAGSAELTVQASTTVPVGRAFASDTRSQTQILAGSSESTVSATATATWASEGAVPALSARENCAKGGVDITAANSGDAPYTFTLMGTRHTIPAGQTRTVTIPLQEDQAYDFTIKGPHGFEKRIRGVLDCATTSAAGSTAGGGLRTQATTQPSPASVGGTGSDPDTDLAETGSSNATPIIAGIAVLLVLVGGASIVLGRKKKSPGADDSAHEGGSGSSGA